MKKLSLLVVLSTYFLSVSAVQGATIGFNMKYDNQYAIFVFSNISDPGTVDIISLSIDLTAASTSASASSSGTFSSDLRFDTAGSPSGDFSTQSGASSIPVIVYPDSSITDGQQNATMLFGSSGFNPGETLRFTVDIDSYVLGLPQNNIVGLENALLTVIFNNGQELSALTFKDPPNPDRIFLANNSIALATVPVPTAIWLFGSGLLGLIGIARRKN